MNENQISTFEKVHAQLESLHSEITTLSKKVSNDALNKFKLKYVNLTVSQANSVLGKKYRPFDDFEQFDESVVPTNSDVTLILGQYLNCMEKLRADNIERKEKWDTYQTKLIAIDWYWTGTKIKTGEPKKIK